MPSLDSNGGERLLMHALMIKTFFQCLVEVLMWRFHYQIVIDTILTSRLILLRKSRELNI